MKTLVTMKGTEKKYKRSLVSSVYIFEVLESVQRMFRIEI